MKNANMCLSILSRLMNEENVNSDIHDIYDKIFDYVHREFVSALDDGCYTANAEIIKALDNILEQCTIFNAIRGLVEKRIVAIWGAQFHIENSLMNKILGPCKWIRNNTNIPMIILPGEGKSRICSLTYMNKLIKLDDEEYRIITGELYKHNIEIRKLIKCFVVYAPYEYEHLSFMLLPQYTENTNDVYEQLASLYEEEYLLVDTDNVWEKIVKKIPHDKLILLCKEETSAIERKFEKGIQIADCADFCDICKSNNYAAINHNIESKILNTVLDAEVFYTNSLVLVGKRVGKA